MLVISGLTLVIGGKTGTWSIHVVAPITPWLDYIFSKMHQLQPLSAVEQFVKANRHLPEMPSAAAVQANGLDLGQMDALLLKKIEELTLYLIALTKENEALKERVSKLEN